MKRTVITVTVVGILILLTVRMFFVLIGRSNEKKKEFVSKLQYDFSARVDSIGLFNERAPVGFLYLKVTRGAAEADEKKINRSFKKNSGYRFIVPRKERLEIFSREVRKFQVGDSLVVNSDDDKFTHFRAGEKLADYEISDHLRESN